MANQIMRALAIHDDDNLYGIYVVNGKGMKIAFT
jgi:hypothetical protein